MGGTEFYAEPLELKALRFVASPVCPFNAKPRCPLCNVVISHHHIEAVTAKAWELLLCWLKGRDQMQLAVTVRQEVSVDAADIRLVNRLAFAGDAEADLVDTLRQRGKVLLSLLAECGSRVIGHILFSRVTLDPAPPGLSAVGLAPLSVLPEFQNQGVGSLLVRKGLAHCRDAGHQVVVVLGHPAYYPRFGFVPAGRFGIRSEFDVPDEVFMILELNDRVLGSGGGTARYESEFNLF